MPLRHRHGYAVDLHRGLPDPAGETGPGVHRQSPPWRGKELSDTRRPPAHIHRIEWAGTLSRGVTTPVPRVHLPVSLTGPGPSGDAEPARLRHDCSPPYPAFLQVRLSSASSARYDEQTAESFHLRSITRRLVAHPLVAW